MSMEVKVGTPDQEVADRAVAEFRKQKLLSEEGIKRIEKGLPTGNLTSEDWRIVFETDDGTKEPENAEEN
jgi:hypothetical protein